MTDEIEARVKKIIVEHLGVGDDKVVPDAALEELGADSLDTVELMMAFEEEFECEISDEEGEKVVTVADAIALVKKNVSAAAA